MSIRTLIPSYVNPRRFNGAALNSATLIAAVASYGATPGTVFIEPGTWTIDASFSVPKNLRLWFDEGVVWNVATGVTVTLAAAPIIGDSQSVFVLAGTGKVVFPGRSVVAPEWFGAMADGATDDGIAFNKAVLALPAGGTIQCTPGLIYGVSDTNRIRLKSYITLDLNGATIQRVGSFTLNNLVENFTYTQPAADFNIQVKNGKIKGTGVNTATQTITLAAGGFTPFDPADVGRTFTDAAAAPASGTITAYDNAARTVTVTGAMNFTGACTTTAGVGAGTFVSTTNVLSNTVPAANLYFYGVDGFLLENLEFENSNGDNLGWRQCFHGLVRNVRGGRFGRNGFSPVSGTNNRIVDCDFTALGFTGAGPGEFIDIENDSALEVSSTWWTNVKAGGITFVDFYTLAAGDYAHEAQFENCKFTGGSPQTFRVIASNSVNAKNFVVGASCDISVDIDTATAFKIGNVNGVRVYAPLSNNSGAAGTSRAIETSAAVDNFVFKGSINPGFANGVVATVYPFTNSIWEGADLQTSNFYAASNGNKFYNCKAAAMVFSAASSNFASGCTFTTVSLAAVSTLNDFAACTIGTVNVDGAGSINNRFRVDTQISAKNFTGGATWLGQVFQNEAGSFTPTISGSTSGGATTTTAWGRYNVVGDMLYYSMSLVWNASTGVGDQRLNLNLPNSIVPVDAVTPSRWAAAGTPFGFAFTGSQVIFAQSGGNGFLTPYGLANTGVTTAVPASTAAGSYESITGSFRIR